MKSITKYILYMLGVVVVITLLFYLRDNISFWLSRMGTYAVIICVTFLAGWLLGRMGAREKYKARIDELQRRIDEPQR